MSDAIDQEPGAPIPELQDHWLKVFFRRLPLWLRLVIVGIIAVFLITLPLLIVFHSWEPEVEPEPAPIVTPAEPPAPAPPIDF